MSRSACNQIAMNLARSRRVLSRRRFAQVIHSVLVTLVVVVTGNPLQAETSLSLLRRETRELLTQEAILEETQAKKSAAVALCDLYVILRCDPRYANSELLQGDATRIRRRLLSIASRQENQLRREGIEKPPTLALTVNRAIEASLTQQDQQLLDPVSSESPAETAPGAAGSFGAGSLGAGGGAFGGGAVGGDAWQIVELIQRIVAPDLWDSRGGPASIQYFAIRRVLVVRATTDVHEQIRDLLTALR